MRTCCAIREATRVASGDNRVYDRHSSRLVDGLLIDMIVKGVVESVRLVFRLVKPQVVDSAHLVVRIVHVDLLAVLRDDACRS